MFHETELCNRSMMMRGINRQEDPQLRMVLEGLQDGDSAVLERLLKSGLLVGDAQTVVRRYLEQLDEFADAHVVLSDARTHNWPHAHHANDHSQESRDHQWSVEGNLFFYAVTVGGDEKPALFFYLCLGAKR